MPEQIGNDFSHLFPQALQNAPQTTIRLPYMRFCNNNKFLCIYDDDICLCHINFKFDCKELVSFSLVSIVSFSFYCIN